MALSSGGRPGRLLADLNTHCAVVAQIMTEHRLVSHRARIYTHDNKADRIVDCRTKMSHKGARALSLFYYSAWLARTTTTSLFSRSTTSEQARPPAEFKHIIKRRKRN
uniref:Uncharacterized protein n=1 Tax=Trichogramma kaykai TaxID=54128 RepID=A0ABD2WKI9_9HYME